MSDLPDRPSLPRRPERPFLPWMVLAVLLLASSALFTSACSRGEASGSTSATPVAASSRGPEAAGQEREALGEPEGLEAPKALGNPEEAELAGEPEPSTELAVDSPPTAQGPADTGRRITRQGAHEPAAGALRVGTAAPQEPALPSAEEEALRRRELELRERELALREAELERRERRFEEQAAEVAQEPEEPAAPFAQEAGGDDVTALPEASEGDLDEPIATPEPVRVVLSAQRLLQVEVLTRLASDEQRPGDVFRVRVVEPVYVGEVLAVPAGSEILGRVVEAEGLKKVGGKARLALEVTDLILPDGGTVPLHASLVEEGPSETRRDGRTIGAAAAGGAILGRILKRDHKTRGTVLGAILGAAAGTAIAARSEGQEVEIPAGTLLELRLDEPLELEARW